MKGDKEKIFKKKLKLKNYSIVFLYVCHFELHRSRCVFFLEAMWKYMESSQNTLGYIFNCSDNIFPIITSKFLKTPAADRSIQSRARYSAALNIYFYAQNLKFLFMHMRE